MYGETELTTKILFPQTRSNRNTSSSLFNIFVFFLLCYVIILFFVSFLLFVYVSLHLCILFRAQCLPHVCFLSYIYIIFWWCTQNFNVWKKHLCYLLIIFAYNKHLLQLMVEYVNSDTFGIRKVFFIEAFK